MRTSDNPSCHCIIDLASERTRTADLISSYEFESARFLRVCTASRLPCGRFRLLRTSPVQWIQARTSLLAVRGSGSVSRSSLLIRRIWPFCRCFISGRCWVRTSDSYY
jgi:hypothetical protein